MAKSEEQAMEAFLVTGFSPMLDWRPIQFSKTPRPLICDLCGVLSMRPFFPGSCTHWYCEPCYQKVLRHDPPLCPLDRREVSKDGLASNTFSVDLRNLLGQAGMRCPNSLQGCNYVLKEGIITYDQWCQDFLPPLLNLEAHYPDCKFFNVSCEVCGTSVVNAKIVEHIKNGCRI
ncbi:unnamed protein product [Ixodes persulcatus]